MQLVILPADSHSAERGWLAKLAQTIDTDRAFDRLPILADALEDAGCSCADILNHCWQGDEHVRGCWVVDLLTRKIVTVRKRKNAGKELRGSSPALQFASSTSSGA